MFKLVDKKVFKILHSTFLFIWTYVIKMNLKKLDTLEIARPCPKMEKWERLKLFFGVGIIALLRKVLKI